MEYKVRYRKVRENAKAPYHAHNDDAGWDLSVSSIRLMDNGMIQYGCGLAFDFSEVKFADARARSSVWKHNLFLTNGTGTIDAGYRGEVMGVFAPCTASPVDMYMYGERFLQIVLPALAPDDTVVFEEVKSLASGSREDNGYGSTGR